MVTCCRGYEAQLGQMALMLEEERVVVACRATPWHIFPAPVQNLIM